jgi:hypothetical protein
MKPTARLVLAFGMFFTVTATSVLLIALEWVAKPLRFINIRAVAVLAALHDSSNQSLGS